VLLRLLVLVLLVMGVMLWMGHAGSLQAHIGLGFLFALLVLLQGLLGALAGAGWGLAGWSLVWAVLLPVIGLGQRTFMLGGAHWVVQVVHLLFGLAAMLIVERIGKRALSKPPAA
ncbi:MAG: hypothetical protein ACREN3_06380, partial [Gemmatimonadaceae bacterium]